MHRRSDGLVVRSTNMEQQPTISRRVPTRCCRLWPFWRLHINLLRIDRSLVSAQVQLACTPTVHTPAHASATAKWRSVALV